MPRLLRQIQRSGNQSALSFLESLGPGERSRAASATASSSGFSPALTVSQPHDKEEREADQLAQQALQPPGLPQNRCSACEQRGAEHKCPKCQGHERKLKREAAGAGPAVAPAIAHNVLGGPGRPLEAATRAFFEPRFGQDFSSVKVHTDARAAESARAVNASAFAVGHDVVFGAGQYSPETEPGRRLLAHELAHVTQYDDSPPTMLSLRRKLLATGAANDIRDFLDMMGPPAGTTLTWDPATHEVKMAPLQIAPMPRHTMARSKALFDQLDRLVKSTVVTQIHLGRHQPGAGPAIFDQPGAPGEQALDIDDFLKIEAGAPGSGVALAAHELEENFQAQQRTGPWKSRYVPSHAAAKPTESAVAEQLVAPGQRAGSQTSMPKHPTPTTLSDTEFIDYTNYYLAYEMLQDTPTRDISVQRACRLDKVTVGKHTLDGFAPNSPRLPGHIKHTDFATAVLKDMNSVDASTVLIEGFAAPGENTPDDLSRDRAQAFFNDIPSFKGQETATIIARGVVPQPTQGHPEKDRKVVVTVSRPVSLTCPASAQSQPSAPATSPTTGVTSMPPPQVSPEKK